MALKNVQRVTFSLPKSTIYKMEIKIPSSKRSKFIAHLIEKELQKTKIVTAEDVNMLWDSFAEAYKPKKHQSALEMQREDRLSH